MFLADQGLPLASGPLGAVVSEVLGGVAYDHVRRINARYGWLADGLEQGRAMALASALAAAGHEPLVRRDDDLLRPAQKLHVRTALLRGDALHVPVSLAGELRALPWAALSLVGIGSVPVARQVVQKTKQKKWGINFKAMALTGVPLPQRKTIEKSHLRQVSDEGVLLQLLFAREGVTVEVQPAQFDYGYLEERLATTSRENWALLLADLEELGREARWTDMAKAYLDTGKLAPAFRDVKDFEHYLAWVAQLS
ncbi:MAG: hypothetical protein AB7N76_17350 [Planctomycetota bacterium]